MNVSTFVAASIVTAFGVTAFTIRAAFLTPHPPVVEQVELLDLEVFGHQAGMKFEWVNNDHCRFLGIGAAQGSVAAPDDLRTQIHADFGPSEGPHGKGRHQNKYWWKFTKPVTPFHGPDFMLTVWHRCGDEDVRSLMYVAPMELVFEGTQ